MNRLFSGLRVNLFLACCLFLMQSGLASGQDLDTNKKQVWLGFRFRPLGEHLSVSAANEFVVQFTGFAKHFNPTFKFGISDYSPSLLSDNTIDYHISAVYVKPGITFFLPGKETRISRFYTTLSVSFCELQHDMTVTIYDSNWGPTKFNFNSNKNVVSPELDMGVIFKIIKRLHIMMGATASIKFGNDNPFDKIQGFEQVSTFTPGTGYGTDFSFDFYFGLICLLN